MFEVFCKLAILVILIQVSKVLIVILIVLTKRKLESETIDKRLKIAIMSTILSREILLTILAIILASVNIANMRNIVDNRTLRS